MVLLLLARRGLERVDEVGFRQIAGVRTRNNVALGVDLAVFSLGTPATAFRGYTCARLQEFRTPCRDRSRTIFPRRELQVPLDVSLHPGGLDVTFRDPALQSFVRRHQV